PEMTNVPRSKSRRLGRRREDDHARDEARGREPGGSSAGPPAATNGSAHARSNWKRHGLHGEPETGRGDARCPAQVRNWAQPPDSQLDFDDDVESPRRGKKADRRTGALPSQ